jgi:invasion protein IalB
MHRRPTPTACRHLAATAAIALLVMAGGAAAQTDAPGRTATWQTSCPPGAPCIAYAQSGGQTSVGTVAVRLSVGQRSPTEPIVVVDIGTPVVQARGFGLGVDDNRPLVISGAAADALVQQFRKGKEAVLLYFATERQPVRIHVTLKGFTAAYRKVSAGGG